jgi:hypothetical protein
VKPILAVIGGFVLSFGMFVAGILFALFVIGDGPQQAPSMTNGDIADVWTSEPRAVNTDAQAFERLPAKQSAATGIEANAAAAEPAAATAPAVDTMTTAAIPSEATATEAAAEEPAVNNRAAKRLFTAHAGWCANRYRSYDASTNSYTPFNGGRRQCMSPYWAQYAALTGAATPEGNQRFVPPAEEWSEEASVPSHENEVSVEYVGDDTLGDLVIDDRHVRDCFSRYRSYRPEDNTYQPWGGGQRRQCE